MTSIAQRRQRVNKNQIRANFILLKLSWFLPRWLLKHSTNCYKSFINFQNSEKKKLIMAFFFSVQAAFTQELIFRGSYSTIPKCFLL